MFAGFNSVAKNIATCLMNIATCRIKILLLN